MFTIYRKGSNNVIRAVIEPSESSVQQVGLMRENVLALTFSFPANIAFEIGDYAFFGENSDPYFLNKLPAKVKTQDRNYAYTMTLEAYEYVLNSVLYLSLNSNNNFTDGKFSLRGTALTFGELLIYNLERLYPVGGWQLGNIIDTPFETLEFDSDSCKAALIKIAAAFKTEYLIVDRTIHIYQRQLNSGYTLGLGQNQGLKSLSENYKENLITRLYVYGSSKNISPSYRNAVGRLILPGPQLYLSQNEGEYGIIEGSKVYDGTDDDVEIYPHRTGTVSQVITPFVFEDSSIDFNVNDYLLSGVTAQIVFNSGFLSGYTFDISFFDNVTKRFTILKNEDETAIDIPSTDYTPVIGDSYVLINIYMPPSYIATAESRLKAAGAEYLNRVSSPNATYSAVCDPIYFKKNSVKLQIATAVKIVDAAMAINATSRVVAFTRNIRKPYIYTVEFADTVPAEDLLVKLIKSL